MIRVSWHMTIPPLMQVQTRAPASAAPPPWWSVAGVTCLAAYQPKGAASYAASKVNLANPGTYDAGDGAAYPTWAANTGWTFNTSQYLTTAIPAYSEPISVLARVVIPSAGTYPTLAQSDAAYGATLRLTNSTRYLDLQEQAYSQIGQGVTALTGGTSHVVGFTFGADKAWSIWLDGAADKTGTYSRLLTGAGTFRIGAAVNSWNASVQAMAFYSAVLTAPQATALTTAMNAL